MRVTERRVSASWSTGPMNARVEMEGGYRILVDEPVDAGGTGMGPGPTDLLLSSVASCFTLALVYSARKHQIALESVQVEVVGTYDGPRYRAIDIVARLGGVDAPARQKLVQSAERVCYVTNTLRTPPTITVVAN